MSSNVEFPVGFQQDESYSAAITRRAVNVGLQRGGSVGSVAGGVNGVGDLAVSQNGTPNMSVNIAVGEGIVPGTSSSTQSGYYVYNNAISNAAIATAPSVNSRIDLATVLVNDQAYGAVSDGGVIATVTGTVSGSPVAPSTPANSLLLADIAVGTSVSSITTGNITDARTFLKPPAVESYINSNVTLTSGQTNIASVVLPPGTWSVTGRALCVNTATTVNNDIEIWLGPTSASTSGAYAGGQATVGQYAAGYGWAAEVTVTKVITVTVPTTVYLEGTANGAPSTGFAVAATTIATVGNATGITATPVPS